MTSRPTSREVFLQSVADRLAGAPYANHPVQFAPTPSQMFLTVCTLCHSVVQETDQTAHREWHDAHVAVHDEILAEAQRYVSPPTYRGLR